MTLSQSLFVIGLLIAASAFFSMAEISLAAARRLRLRQMADEGDARADRALRMQELAARLVVNKSSLTRVVDRMQEQGLVERELCEDDGRGVQAVLTRDGREELRRCAPTHLRGVHEHFTQYLTDSDVTALQRVFAKLPGPDQRG